jgi:hypothetical protein
MSIVDKDGRSISTQSDADEVEALRKQLEGLGEDEREALMLMLAELQDPPEDGEKPLVELVSEAEFKHTPVDIETFVKDEYYLGNTCSTLYPQLMKDMKVLFGSGHYEEAILTGSIGWGKTFFASIGVCRVLYELSCLKNPHRSFGLATDSNIAIVCLSVNETLAMKVAFENIATKVKASPYFQENFPFKHTKKEFRFPNNVWLAARATTDTAALGLNVIGALLDETNFMDRGRAIDPRLGAVDHAELIYTGLMRRMKSRFGRQGRLPGKLFLVSSKKTKDDFTARRIAEARNVPAVFVRDYALWDVKPSDYHSSKTFTVLCGNDQVPSRVLSEDEAKKTKGVSVADGCTLINVPEDFRFDFENDLENAIRDIAGVATVAISPFIQRREKLVWEPKMEHPFSTEVFDPSKPGAFVWPKMVRKTAVKDLGGYDHEELRPIIHPTHPRHVHIDPAYRKDRVGFCMGHIYGWTDVLRRSEDGGEVYQERAPVFFIDLILQIVPPVGDEIVLGDIRRLVYDLSAHGYMITGVSMDTWQSVDALQHLKRKGYRAEHLSVDTSPDPYNKVKSAFYEDRIKVYKYEPLFKELRQLERVEEKGKKLKIDHPKRGSKDVSDALAGCIHQLEEKQSSIPLPIMKGVSYSPDAWMEEQMHHAAARQEGSSDGRFYLENHHAPVTPAAGAMLPPIFGGRGGGPDWGGGWTPNSL